MGGSPGASEGSLRVLRGPGRLPRGPGGGLGGSWGVPVGLQWSLARGDTKPGAEACLVHRCLTKRLGTKALIKAASLVQN